ncbi:pilus assembly protein TadB [Pacificimonas flava]|uniref:Pilus assembly protein TadB n=2 Tax=Pacificimonas TaxID=1960290 RepID=A0A219B237_9SPHN|nr:MULTISPECIES: type II secretion system F family protein [Pacificimonas]MBZ6377920.1 type II secretion system F family protein [Pacificimonas aurantium]OWV32422.1 pilus assembly protein TadB [Pacificimonas flava]
MSLDVLILIVAGGIFATLALLILAFSGDGGKKKAAKRLSAVRERHSDSAEVKTQAQMRKIVAARETKLDSMFSGVLPNKEVLRIRLAKTGKKWGVGQYMLANLLLVGLLAGVFSMLGLPGMLALLLGIALGLFIPHFTVGFLISRRTNDFTTRFPDAIELLTRGLRSGLPIGESVIVVGREIPGVVGEEFRAVSDKVRIGRTMDQALQETANRIGTPEFQFFVITLNIQRETGGNLAETLNNLADVLRKRQQMKLKIKAMSSESKASAYIVGSLPFIVFGLIHTMDPTYTGGFFEDSRLIIAGIFGLIWMSIGAFIMAKMVSFEI